METPTGEIVDIGIEYERIRKRCYQCQRLTHDKENCPFNPSNRQAIATRGIKALNIPSHLIPKISKDDPMFGELTDDDVGIDIVSGKPKIAKAVLDEMRQYLSVVDLQEKKVRIERVRRSVWDLDGDSHGQKTMLRLEAPVKVTIDVNKGKGLVFNFEGSTNFPTTSAHKNIYVVSSRKSVAKHSQPGHSSSDSFATASQNENGSTGMLIGFVAGSSGTKPNHAKKRRIVPGFLSSLECGMA